jgi:predicted RNA-binding protein YlxR (DUF448 family)/ribosomal protein L7Ae-like RNA K-turn-binding protein
VTPERATAKSPHRGGARSSRNAGGAGASPARVERPARARTCVGCQVPSDASLVRRATGRVQIDEPTAEDKVAPLVRLVLGPDHEIVVDAQHGSFGRGAYVHATRACLDKASRAGLARAVRGAPRLDGTALTLRGLASAIVEAYGRRIVGLLAAARRARKLVWGADAVAASLAAGDASLVVVATDAAAAADRSEVRSAVREGRAIAWADKATLGRLARGDDAEVGVLAVTDTRLSQAIREARTVVDVASSAVDGAVSRKTEQPSPASRHASILDEGAASLRTPDPSGSGAGGPALGSAE